MKTIHVLSIGNSFSEDAQYYLHDFSRSEGVNVEAVNLYIPGCSLYKHFQNMISGKREYILEVNGHKANGFLVSMKEALLAREWDVITVQQASHLSFDIGSFFPYINRLAAYIREMCPHAKLLIHQTWAYQSDSKRILDHGFQSYDEMFEQVKACYDKAKESIGADGIIPSGSAFQYALSHGVESVHRDTFHASMSLGRFILALVWYGCITGYDIANVKFNDFDEPISDKEYRIALDAAAYVLDRI